MPRQKSETGDDTYNYTNGWLIAFLIVFIIVMGIFFWIRAVVVSNAHRTIQNTHTYTIGQNKFFTELSTHEYDDSAIGYLAKSIQPILASDPATKTDSVLVPKGLAGIYIPNDAKLTGLKDQMGCVIADVTGACKVGPLADFFINKIYTFNQSGLNTVLTPVPPDLTNRGISFTPWGMSILEFWGGLYILISLSLAIIVMWFMNDSDREYITLKRTGYCDNYKVEIMILAPLLGAARLIQIGWEHIRRTSTTHKANKLAKQARETNPMAGEIMVLKERIKHIQKMPGYNNSQAVQQLEADTKKLITELEDMPNVLNSQATAQVVDSLLHDNADIRARRETILKEIKELS